MLFKNSYHLSDNCFLFHVFGFSDFRTSGGHLKREWEWKHEEKRLCKYGDSQNPFRCPL